MLDALLRVNLAEARFGGIGYGKCNVVDMCRKSMRMERTVGREWWKKRTSDLRIRLNEVKRQYETNGWCKNERELANMARRNFVNEVTWKYSLPEYEHVL